MLINFSHCKITIRLPVLLRYVYELRSPFMCSSQHNKLSPWNRQNKRFDCRHITEKCTSCESDSFFFLLYMTFSFLLSCISNSHKKPGQHFNLFGYLELFLKVKSVFLPRIFIFPHPPWTVWMQIVENYWFVVGSRWWVTSVLLFLARKRCSRSLFLTDLKIPKLVYFIDSLSLHITLSYITIWI